MSQKETSPVTHQNVKIYINTAFCKDGAGGNKAGVVFDHPELTNEEKMQISKALGFSETVFVTASDRADYKLEYFTPTEEVPLCGHATIATFATMYHLGMVAGKICSIETKAGILEVSVAADGLVMMEQNAPMYYDWVDRSDLTPCLGPCVSEAKTSRIVSTGLRDIIVPCKSVEDLNSAEPNFRVMTDLSCKLDVVGIHAYAVPELADGVDAICRNFAPLYGIDEESATGTASCALAGYLWQQGCQKEQYLFEQGYSMNLPSKIIVKVNSEDGHIKRIFVGGYGKVLSE